MAIRKNRPEVIQSGTAGPMPTDWFDVNTLDGTAYDFATAGPGSSYVKRDLTNDLAGLPVYKLKNTGATYDWGGLQCICERVALASFTDGGSTSGTYNLKTQVPAGAWVHRTILQNVTGFTGDTSAVLIVGDGTDTDRYNTGTPSVFTTATAIDMGAPSGTQIHTAAKTVTLTITSGSDWGAVTAGALTIKIFYYI